MGAAQPRRPRRVADLHRPACHPGAPAADDLAPPQHRALWPQPAYRRRDRGFRDRRIRPVRRQHLGDGRGATHPARARLARRRSRLCQHPGRAGEGARRRTPRPLICSTATASAEYIGVRDMLDPQNGMRARRHRRARPHLGRHQYRLYARSPARRASMPDFGSDDDFVGALRGKVGTIAGPNGAPPDRLFFAGGGGSVRGYEYQSLSPRDIDNKLIGGRSHRGGQRRSCAGAPEQQSRAGSPSSTQALRATDVEPPIERYARRRRHRRALLCGLRPIAGGHRSSAEQAGRATPTSRSISPSDRRSDGGLATEATAETAPPRKRRMTALAAHCAGRRRGDRWRWPRPAWACATGSPATAAAPSS